MSRIPRRCGTDDGVVRRLAAVRRLPSAGSASAATWHETCWRYPTRQLLIGEHVMHRASKAFLSLVAGFALGLSTAAMADGAVPTPAASIDSGLGALPHYSQWREPWLYAMPAEKVDSGLGTLPPYAEWREPWLYSQPAEKIDSGLGEITRRAATAAATRK
jgi:hypothetical protein